MEKEETSTYTIRVPNQLKKAFELAAKATDRTGAQLIRDHMRQYVAWYMEKNAQGDLLAQEKQTQRKKK